MTDNFISLKTLTLNMQTKIATTNSATIEIAITLHQTMTENFKYYQCNSIDMENKNTTTDKESPFFNGA